MFPVQEVERMLGVSFRDPKLLICAFTHRSILNERRDWPTPHNERLEFLGDAVLELVATEVLFQKAPHADEGKLTRWRTTLVRTETLAHCAKKSNFQDFIAMSRGQRRDNGRALDLILANTLEAIFGAIYLDQGFVAARTFAKRFLFSNLDDEIIDQRSLDPKSILQEKAQEILRVTPSYQEVERSGPAHNAIFTVAVSFGTDVIAKGSGHSKQVAEQQAAASALQVQGW